MRQSEQQQGRISKIFIYFGQGVKNWPDRMLTVQGIRFSLSVQRKRRTTKCPSERKFFFKNRNQCHHVETEFQIYIFWEPCTTI